MTNLDDLRAARQLQRRLWKGAIILALASSLGCSRSTSPPVTGDGGTERLFVAKTAQDVRSALADGADVAATRPYRRQSTGTTEQTTALWVAARWGRSEVVGELIASGAEVDATAKPSLGSPLWIAAREGHLATVRALLRSGAEVDRRNQSGMTALVAAVIHGDVEVVKLLLRSGANPNERTDSGVTPLLVPLLRVKAGVASFPRRSRVDAPPFAETRPLLEALWSGGGRVNSMKNPAWAGHPPMEAAMPAILVTELGTKEEFRWLYERRALRVSAFDLERLVSTGRSDWFDQAKPIRSR